MTRNGCPLRLDVGLPIITIFRQVLILLCKGSQSEWNLVSGYEMSAYNYSSAALVIVVGLLPLCLVVRFIGMVYLSDCQKPYPDETGHRDGKIERQKWRKSIMLNYSSLPISLMSC